MEMEGTQLTWAPRTSPEDDIATGIPPTPRSTTPVCPSLRLDITLKLKSTQPPKSPRLHYTVELQLSQNTDRV